MLAACHELIDVFEGDGLDLNQQFAFACLRMRVLQDVTEASFLELGLRQESEEGDPD